MMKEASMSSPKSTVRRLRLRAGKKGEGRALGRHGRQGLVRGRRRAVRGGRKPP